MKHATRFNALARRTGGAATSLVYGALFSAGLLGTVHMVAANGAADGGAPLQFSDAFALPAAEPTTSELSMVSGLGLRVTPPVSPAVTLADVSYTPSVPFRRATEQPVEPALKAFSPAVTGLEMLGEDPFAQEEGELSIEMARVRDWITENYRVSETAIVPALAAAEASAQELGFDPLLIVAMMAVESSFNPRAVSNMGAQGLMQVIPRYHQDKLGANRGKNALFDPEVNVRVGTLVLHEGLQRYGSLQRALQYYNGALKDPQARYTRKVMSLKKRLMLIAGRDVVRTSLEQAS
ncbi:MAG TPA: lytic transglycosylase [Thauera sp.]|nr:lytic transglycosylase [Thauera sp.]HRJ25061.1 transglycosylase SLT domain-containing protein [Thauera sp.]